MRFTGDKMIYFIHHDGHIKIGISARPWERLASLQTAHHAPLEMLAIMPGGRAEEIELHRHYSAFRVNREWFRDNENLRQYIQQAREMHPDLQVCPQPSRVKPIRIDHEFSDEELTKICSWFDPFIQVGGRIEFREYEGRFLIGLPGVKWTGKNDPGDVCIIQYDDGRITPKIDREVKPRPLTDRLNSALAAVVYFYRPDTLAQEDYGIALRFRRSQTIVTAPPEEPPA